MLTIIRKHWAAALAILPILPTIWRELVRLFDWGARIDLVATKLHEAGGMSGILGFLLNPPSWLIWPALAITVLLLLWDRQRNEPHIGRRRMSSWGPWLLIVGGPLVGLIWLFFIGENAQPAPAAQIQTKPVEAIVWDFEDPEKPTYFLGLVGGRGDVTFVTSFQAKGKNNTGQPLLRISGFIRSDVTNETFPMFMNKGGHPVPPEATKGVPRDEYFMITVPFDRILAQKFLVDFGKFSFVFEYDGHPREWRFTTEQIENLIIRFERETRRPDRH